MNFDEALISRRMTVVSKDMVLIEERWDTTHPMCPFVPGPYSNPLQSPYVNQIVMTPAEYAEIKPALK